MRLSHGVHYFFRYDWQDGTFRTTETELPDADLAWVRDTMVAYTKALPPLRDRADPRLRLARRPFGPFKNLAVILTNDSYAMLFGERDQEAGARRLRRRARHRAGCRSELYGYVTDPKPFLAPAFASIRGKSRSAARCFPNR